MNRKIMTKSIAAMLAFILTFANVILLGIYTQESIATSVNLEEQSTKVSNASVEFDAYFKEEGEAKHSKSVDVAANNEKLYLNVKVTDGYLANATVQIKNSNFKLAEAEGELQSVQSIDTETNTVALNQINKNESVTIELPIEIITDSDFDVQNIDKVSNVVLEGTFVDNNAKETSISKTIEVNAKMVATAEANIDVEAITFVPFEIDSKKGVVFQYLIKSNVENDVLPIEKTELTIEVPMINNKEAEKISVSAKSTKATNGGAEKVFVLNEDYTYEDGKIKLTIKNEADENGKISWVKGAHDEIVLTLIYGEDAVADSAQVSKIDVKNQISLYTNDILVVNGENYVAEQTLNSTIGQIVSYDISLNKNEISKGYMLVEGANNTPYVEERTAIVGNKELVDNIILDSKEKYVDENSNTYQANIPYTYTKISGENFLSMLGESGYIKIYNKDDELIATINKDNLQYNYQTETTYIKLETSKPIAEGILNVENGREVKAAEYAQNQTAMFKQIEEKINGKATYQGTDLFAAEKTIAIELTDPKTKIETTINRASLSTIEVNEAVEIRTVLDTSDNRAVLYKNPKVTIEFPSYVKKVTSQAAVLYGQGLQLDTTNLKQYTNDAGNIVVEVPVIGEQTEFNTSSVSDGAVVLVSADVTVDELAPAITDTIKVTVTNENALSTSAEENIQISYAAEKKVLTRNAIRGYNDANETTSSMNEIKTATIEPNATAKTATIKLDMVNSTGNEITDVKVLGRIPFAGNKSVVSNTDLGSTFDTNMVSAITGTDGTNLNDVDVYYSGNGNATSDLTNTENGWAKTPTDMSKVKSYMIVFKTEKMENGAKASFEYNVQIPEEIGEEQKAYSVYAVYYKEEGTQKSKDAAVVGLMTNKLQNIGTVTTGEGIEINVLESTCGNIITQLNEVKEGQYIDYTVTIKNKSENKQILDLEVAKENGTFYGLFVYAHTSFDDEELHMYEELADETLSEIITIEPNETYTYKYTLVVDPNTEGQNLISTVSLKKNNEKVVDDTVITNTINKGLIKLTTKYNNAEESISYSQSSYSAFVAVSNISGKDLSNVIVEVELPELLSYYPFEIFEEESDYDLKEVNGQKLKYTINQLRTGEEANIYIPAKPGSIDISKECEEIELYSTAIVEGETYTSNIATNKIMQGETVITAKMTGSIQGEYVNDGDEIVYTVEIENKGILTEYYLSIKDIIPECLRVQKYTITYNNGSEEVINTNYNNILVSSIQIKPKEKIILKITTNLDEKLTEDEIITNSASISGRYFETFKTNTVTYKIRRTINPDTPDTPDNTSANKYKISGLAWYDANFNGKRDTNEKLLSGIKVLLMNNDNSEFVKDSNGQDIYILTQNDGAYSFEGLETGEYVVVFQYDINTYKPAIYQATDVTSNKNSDAIDTQIRINGVETKVATSDIISIGESDRENIDLGLIDLYEFDLKIDKEVKTIIVQNRQGTETYTFEDGKAAKVEIPAKYMVGTTLTIEYKLSVTNEGDVPGKVLKIADYMPKDLEFNSEINLEWYQGTDGNLYTQELENTIINPGETKEITLVLTKVLKEEAAEIINNTVEISETYNTQGKLDRDSTPGNNVQDEDDLSYADLIITIKTGAGTYMLIILGIVVLIGIFASGIYLIKKKVLTEEI